MTFALVSCSTVQETSCNNPQITKVSDNFSYVNLGELRGYPSDHTTEIGAGFALWEQQNPNRKIVAYQIDFQPHDYANSPYVLGISIYSQLK